VGAEVTAKLSQGGKLTMSLAAAKKGMFTSGMIASGVGAPGRAAKAAVAIR